MPALGIAVAVAFAAGVAAEGVIAGDQSARAQLAGLSALDRSVRITWQGPVTRDGAQRSIAALRGLGLGPETEVTLLNPVRLSGVIVRPVAISSLSRWLPGGHTGPCRASDCPVLLAGGGTAPRVLSAAGVRLHVVGSEPLRSSVPLAFDPEIDGQWPVLVTGDVAGLDALPGLSGVYRTHTWLAALDTARLHSWQLAAIERRLSRAQAALSSASGQVSFSAPFEGLDAARSEAHVAPARLLLLGGGALASLLAFVVLAGSGLRTDQRAELERLLAAGARTGQSFVFVAGEASWICAGAVVAGAAAGVLVAALLAGGAGEPVGGVLSHSVLTPAALLALAAGWLATTALLTALTLARSARLLDLIAVAAISVVVTGLAIGSNGSRGLTLLIAPLCCLACAVVVFRAAEPALIALERLARRGPALARVAIVSLARAPALPSLAIAFVAVSVGLGGFVLAYRATLLRSAADQAATRVPLDAVVSPGPSFAGPLELASPSRWQRLSGGTVLPVRTTNATYASGSGSVTVPALGVPAAGLRLIHGWRAGYSSVPRSALARRLRPPGPARTPGPQIKAAARMLSVGIHSPAIALGVAAELRASSGVVRQLPLGSAGAGFTSLRARLPSGSWELEALELTEPTGLEITNGHQNSENPAAATQATDSLTLGPVRELGAGGRVLAGVPVGAWRGVGAATTLNRHAGALAKLRFQSTGFPGVVRPTQPSDAAPIPVLADPHTTAAAGPGGRTTMTIDELPVSVRVVGVVRSFPTVPAGAPGFVIADQALLSGALDAQLPGQGLPDQLWIESAHTGPLRAALRSGPLAQLSSQFRVDLERQLRTSPIARGVLRSLLAAAGVTGVLAVLGMLLALTGAFRDRSVERDLAEQGVGARALRSELRTRFAFASVVGALAGLGIALLLTRLTVATVSAAVGDAHPHPPLVTVVPWSELAAWTVGAVAVLSLAGWVASWWTTGRGETGRRARAGGVTEADEITGEPAIR